jgi:hypothetical protein
LPLGDQAEQFAVERRQPLAQFLQFHGAVASYRSALCTGPLTLAQAGG